MRNRIDRVFRSIIITFERGPSWWPPTLWRLRLHAVPMDVVEEFTDTEATLRRVRVDLAQRQGGGSE